MRPLFCGAGVLAVLLMAGLVSGPAGASSDDETPTIKKVMDTAAQGQELAAQHGQGGTERRFARLDGDSETGQGLREIRCGAAEKRPAARRKGVVRKACQGLCVGRPSLWKSRRRKKI